MKQGATVFLVTVLALIAAACGAPAPTQAPTPTATPPTPTATPWALSPQEAAAIDDNINSVIDIARTRMAALKTAHISVSRGRLNLEFDVRFPYEVQGVVTKSGDPEEDGLLLTEGKAFTGDPKGSCWTEISTPFSFVSLYGVNVVSTIIQTQLDLVDSIRNLEQAPDATAEAFYHFRFDIDWPMWFNVWVQGLDQTYGEQAMNEMYPPEFREANSRENTQTPENTQSPYKGEAWIDKETLLVQRFLWKQVSTATGVTEYTWTVTVSRFDQAVPTAPDLEAIARLGPCPEGT